MSMTLSAPRTAPMQAQPAWQRYFADCAAGLLMLKELKYLGAAVVRS